MKFPFDAELIKLSREQSRYFLQRPETGMGYQFLKGNNNATDQPIITNAEFIVDLGKNHNIPIISDFNHRKLDFEEVESGVFDNYITAMYSVITNSKYQVPAVLDETTNPPYLYLTRHGDEFRRLSAFRNDRRIAMDGSILAGTYGTTTTDLTVVPSGISAVGRYALPNRIAACYVYQIIPEPGTPIYFGTVTPNYGLCGGGVEVYFPNGSGPGSAKLLGTIPEF